MTSRTSYAFALAASAGLARAQVVADGSFEVSGAMLPSPGIWVGESTHFDTPLCDAASFGPGLPSAARTGQWWAWFGGVDMEPSSSSLEQVVSIPPGPASLRFYLHADSDRPTPTDFFRVRIDSAPVFIISNTQLGGFRDTYIPVTVDISAYAGASRTLRFECQTSGGGYLTSFFLDDVSIEPVGQHPCYANCDNSTGTPLLSANDFQCFINRYNNNDPYANCDQSTTFPMLTPNDLQCFINKYVSGCP